jgi:hypothetical protein
MMGESEEEGKLSWPHPNPPMAFAAPELLTLTRNIE